MTRSQPSADGVALLAAAWRATSEVVDHLEPQDFERPTRTEAWTVRELLFHLMLDAQRALMVLATPDEGPADTDAVSYWAVWTPGGEGPASHARFVQGSAAAYAGPSGLVAQWRDTSEAALRAALSSNGSGFVATQGHVLTVADFVRTLTVEAVVHHLDLTLETTSPGLPDAAVGLVLEVLTGLLGADLPGPWSPTEAVLKGTGRTPLSVDDRVSLGPAAARFPLFG